MLYSATKRGPMHVLVTVDLGITYCLVRDHFWYVMWQLKKEGQRRRQSKLRSRSSVKEGGAAPTPPGVLHGGGSR